MPKACRLYRRGAVTGWKLLSSFIEMGREGGPLISFRRLAELARVYSLVSIAASTAFLRRPRLVKGTATYFIIPKEGHTLLRGLLHINMGLTSIAHDASHQIRCLVLPTPQKVNLLPMSTHHGLRQLAIRTGW